MTLLLILEVLPMRKLLAILFVVCGFCFAGNAGDVLQSSFTGVVDDICAATTRPSTVMCYDGTLDPSTGAMLDMSGENRVAYSEDLTSWTPTRASVTPNVRKAPDGTWTGDVVHEDASAATSHYVYDTGTVLTIGVPTTVTIWAQPVNRTWIRIVNANSTSGAYFGLTGNGVVGTLLLATDASITYDRGWYKCTVTLTSPASLNLFLSIGEADNDYLFDGLDQDSLAVWGVHAYQRTGQWANKRSPYIRTGAVAKPRHDLAQSPVTPTKSVDLDYQTSGKLDWTKLGITAPTFEIDFSQDPSGATITANTGQILTKVGAPDRVTDGTWPLTLAGAEGQAHSFDGTNDYYTSTIGPPAGDFSVACVVTPDTVTGTYFLMSNGTEVGALRGWWLWQANTSIAFSISDDGTADAGHTSGVSKGSALAVGRTYVVVVSFDYVGDGTSIANLYVDELAVATVSNMDGPVFAGAANLSVGANASGGYKIDGLEHHCAVFNGAVLTAAQAATIIRTWRGLVGPDGTTSIASAAPPYVQLVDPTTSTTRPFLRAMPANTRQIGVHGLDTPAAITNLITEPGVEVWGADADCGRCPTGWGCICTAGDGTSSFVEDTSNNAEKASGGHLSITGTTSSIDMYPSACFTTNIGADLYGELWAYATGTSSFRFRIREYDDAACVTPLQYTDFFSGAIPASWDVVDGKKAAASWHANTSSWRVFLTELGDGGVDVYLDAVQVRAGSYAVPAFCAGTCNHVIPTYPSMLTANGESEIEITAQSPWAGTDILTALPLLLDGATSPNYVFLQVRSDNDEPALQIYDGAGNGKNVLPNVTNWVANTEYNIKAGWTGTGAMRLSWPVGSWNTTTSGVGSGTRSAAQATSYIGASSTVGCDFWIKHVRMTTRGAPYGTSDAALQRNDGNRGSGAKFMGYNYFSKASHDSMNVFDQDHTWTVAVVPQRLQAGVYAGKGSSAGGMWLTTNGATTQKTAVYYAPVVVTYGAGTYSAIETVGVIQETRASSMSTLYDNGSASVATNVAGTGSDNALPFAIGRYPGGDSGHYAGSVFYVRLDSEALSVAELARERQLLQGWGTNKKSQAWTFGRSTVGTGKFGNLSLATVAANVPRLGGPGGGILIENQATQLLRYSQDVNLWSLAQRSTIVADYANDYLAPDGTRTADVIREDSTAANSHYVTDGSKAVATDTYYTLSAYVKKANRSWLFLELDAVATDGLAYFDVEHGTVGTVTNATATIEPSVNGYWRVSMTWNSTTNVLVSPLFLVAEANGDSTFDGLSQDSLVVWGAQLEAGKVPTSYIYSGAAANVVRVADGMSMSAVTAGLPAMICPTCGAKKLKMSVEIKCTNRLPTTPAVQAYIVTLGGAASANNQVQFYLSSTGRYYFAFADSVGTAHSVYSTIDMATCNDWVKLEGSFDTSDLTSLSFTVNGSSTGMTYVGNSGTGTLDTAGLNVQFGNRTASALDNCWHRNLRITVE